MFVIGNYVQGDEFLGFVGTDGSWWSVGGGGRAFVRLGYRASQQSTFGPEGSYSYGWLDFGDDIGGDIQQAYLGVFIAVRL